MISEGKDIQDGKTDQGLQRMNQSTLHHQNVLCVLTAKDRRKVKIWIHSVQLLQRDVVIANNARSARTDGCLTHGTHVMVVWKKEQNALSDGHFGHGLDMNTDALSHMRHAWEVVLSQLRGELDGYTGFESENEQQVDNERIRPI